MEESKRRLISIDLIRGLAIMGVLFFHPLIYGVWQTESNALEIVPFYLVAVFAPLIILGTWGGGFPLISSFINTYNVYNRLEKGKTFKEASIPILLNSTFLILLDPIKALFLSRTWTNAFSEGINYSVLSRLLEKGEFAWPDAESWFQIGALPAIGLSGYMTVFLLWILFKEGGRKKVRRKIIVLSVIGVLWAGTSNFISQTLNPYVGELFWKGGIHIFFAYILRLFIGAQLSFFPMGVYAIFGIIGGYLIVIKADFKWIKYFGFGFGSLFFGGFIVSTSITVWQSIKAGKNPFIVIFDYEIYPRELLFFSLGCMLLIYVGLIKKYEYVSKEKHINLTRKTTFIRRFGVGTLTLYMFEPVFNGLFASIFHRAFGDPSVPWGTPDPFMTNVPAILLFVFTFSSFWCIATYLWSKTGYKFGFEHLVVSLTKQFRKEKTRRMLLYTPNETKKDLTE